MMRLATAGETLPPQSTTFAALHFTNFRLMWVSLLVSNAGTWLQNVAQDFLVYQITGRALDLGYVNVVRAVALISLSFLGGTIADRLDKRKLLIVTQTLFAVLAALLGLLVQLHAVQVWHIVVLSFLGSVLLAIDQPARQAMVPQLVPREYLMNAVALNSVTFTGAAAFGPALAGPVVGLLGITWGFYLNALSFLAVIWAVWALKLPAPGAVKREPERVGQAVASGLKYVAQRPAILLLVSLLTVFSFFAVPYQSLLPVFADRVFHGDVETLGYLRAAPGVGALVGGFILARFAHHPRKDLLVLLGGLGFILTLLAFTASRWLGPALVLLFLGSTLYTVFQSTIQTLMQQLTSDKMRGRVMSLYAVSVIGMWPLGALPMSWASDQFGVARSVAFEAAVAGVVVAAVAFRGMLNQFRTRD